MSRLKSIVAALAMAAAAALPARADTTLVVHYPMPGFFKAVMDTISQKFMAENPDVKISFATPSPTYEDGLQLILREAGTADLPDVSFVGLNRLRLLSERNIVVDLKPLVDKEGDMAKLGFTDHILSLARWSDKQAGLAFATSNPIMYINADLVRRAGGDPDHPPKTWDEVIALGAKVKALGDNTAGIDFRWQGDDWMFSALLFGDGGTMLSPDEKKVTFDGPAGQAAFALVDRMVKEGGMPAFTKPAGEQAFVAGKVGLEFQTTGALRNTIDNVGSKFELRTAEIPLLDPKGRPPAHGRQRRRDPDPRPGQARRRLALHQIRGRPLRGVGGGAGHRLRAQQRAGCVLAAVPRRLLQDPPALPRRPRPDRPHDPLVLVPWRQQRARDADHRRSAGARRGRTGYAGRRRPRRRRPGGQAAATALSAASVGQFEVFREAGSDAPCPARLSDSAPDGRLLAEMHVIDMKRRIRDEYEVQSVSSPAPWE